MSSQESLFTPEELQKIIAARLIMESHAHRNLSLDCLRQAEEEKNPEVSEKLKVLALAVLKNVDRNLNIAFSLTQKRTG